MAIVEAALAPPSIPPIAAPPSVPLLRRLQQPRVALTLLLLMWVPLTIYVMFGSYIGNPLKTYLLAPAIPAAIILYVLSLIHI